MMKKMIVSALLLAVIIGVGYLLLHTPQDPRKLALGEWRESNGQLYVDVTPERATARGGLRGAGRYEWLQTEESPYLLLFTYRHESYETKVSFPDDDTAVVEVDVWDKLDAAAQRMLREQNRAHNRPDRELRLLFRRMKPAAK